MSNKLYIDVRNLSEITTKIEGAVSYPYPKILVNKEAFRDFCKDAKQIVLFCRSGRRSNSAKGFLAALGIENVEVKTPKTVKEILSED